MTGRSRDRDGRLGAPGDLGDLPGPGQFGRVPSLASRRTAASSCRVHARTTASARSRSALRNVRMANSLMSLGVSSASRSRPSSKSRKAAGRAAAAATASVTGQTIHPVRSGSRSAPRPLQPAIEDILRHARQIAAYNRHQPRREITVDTSSLQTLIQEQLDEQATNAETVADSFGRAMPHGHDVHLLSIHALTPLGRRRPSDDLVADDRPPSPRSIRRGSSHG